MKIYNKIGPVHQTTTLQAIFLLPAFVFVEEIKTNNVMIYGAAKYVRHLEDPWTVLVL